MEERGARTFGAASLIEVPSAPPEVQRFADGLEEGTPAFIERIVALVERIRSGDFAVWPMECPDYCDYRGVCRYEMRGQGSANGE